MVNASKSHSPHQRSPQRLRPSVVESCVSVECVAVTAGAGTMVDATPFEAMSSTFLYLLYVQRDVLAGVARSWCDYFVGNQINAPLEEHICCSLSLRSVPNS